MDARRSSRLLKELENESEDRHVQLQAYILRTMVDDMWDNIGMESSTRIHDDVIDGFVESIGENMKKLSDEYANEEWEGSYSTLTHIYEDYLDWIDKMNEDIGGGHR
jgi:hypothetical protein